MRRVDFAWLCQAARGGWAEGGRVVKMKKVEFLENEESETYTNQKDSPHSAVSLKGNDK